MTTVKKSKAKPPASHIVANEDPQKFLTEVNEYFEKGYRPLQDMKTFASLDQKSGVWRTFYIMPLVHFEELKAFQTVPSADGEQQERMFG